MYIGVVSMRYAKALLAYADDAKVEDAVYREALLLKDSYAQVPELRQAMDRCKAEAGSGSCRRESDKGAGTLCTTGVEGKA